MIPVEPTFREPLAIVGMNYRLPGGINNPESLWQLLCDGGSAIQVIGVHSLRALLQD
jgi:acyl transferase domain-containing protein